MTVNPFYAAVHEAGQCYRQLVDALPGTERDSARACHDEAVVVLLATWNVASRALSRLIEIGRIVEVAPEIAAQIDFAEIDASDLEAGIPV